MPYYPPSSGYTTFQEEGVAVTQRTVVDFVGAGATVTDTGAKTQVAIAGGAGGNPAPTTVEVDLGSVPRTGGTFDIATSGQTAGKKVMIWQDVGPYTGKGTTAKDEPMMGVIMVTAYVESATVIRAYWSTGPKGHAVRGNYKFNYWVCT